MQHELVLGGGTCEFDQAPHHKDHTEQETGAAEKLGHDICVVAAPFEVEVIRVQHSRCVFVVAAP
jgi:hypothetical protein